MIKNKLDGIVSLVETGNFVIIEELLDASLVTVDQIYDAIKTRKKRSRCSHESETIVALMEKIGTIDDQGALDEMIDVISCALADGKDGLMLSFKKLVDAGAKLSVPRLANVSDIAFVYYMLHNDYVVTGEALFYLVAGYFERKPEGANILWQKLETDILSIDDVAIVSCAMTSAINKISAPLLMNEVYNRNLLDIVFVDVLHRYGGRVGVFFDTYLSMCVNAREIAFYASCQLLIDALRATESDLQYFVRTDPFALETLNKISMYNISYTNADVQFIIPKITALIQAYQTAYPDSDESFMTPDFSKY